MQKPAIFIGSSSEALTVADAVAEKLGDVAETTVWNEGVFKPGESFLESLVNALDQFDFAILIMTADDVVTVRENTTFQPRDNLLFELGLFMGRLGRSRTFVLCPTTDRPKLPSDLAGVTYLTFEAQRRDRNLIAGVRDACNTIKKSVSNLGLSDTRGIQRLTASAQDVQEQVHDAVQLLLKSRIWETEVFRNHYGIALNSEEMSRLDSDLAELKRILKKDG